MSGPLLTAGVQPRSVSQVLADILAGSLLPATRILEYLSGTALHLKVTSDGDRPLDAAEAHRLASAGISRCRYRTGLLVTDDGTVAAGVTLTWLPQRLPHEACRALDAGAEPAGRVLDREPGGMYRADCRALAAPGTEEITGAETAVISSAVLMVAGMAVAIAKELITRQFAESLVLPG